MMVEIENVLDHSLCASPNLHLVGGWLINAQKSIFRFYDIVPLLFYFLFGLFCFTLIKSNLLDLRVFWKK